MSLDTSGGTQEVTQDEEAKGLQAYHLNREEKSKPKADFFKLKIREALMETDLFASNAVDNTVKGIDAKGEIPPSLLKAYYGMLAKGLRVRESLDDDY